MGGILNAPAEKSIRIQQDKGPVEFYASGVTKFKGRDVTQMPYGQPRELHEVVIAGDPFVQQASPHCPCRARGR
jgi:hypothetical protein